jgi:NodT family efflux transporter outer membrane factor (OMF) lipoprotein
LSSLIERATRGNPDVQIAVIRIDQARASERVAAAAGMPSLSAEALYARADLGQGLGLGGGFAKPLNVYGGILDASWQLDLFGQVRRSVESSRAAAEAAIGNRDDALVTIEAEVGQTYAQLRAAQASRDTAQADLEIEKQILALTRERAAGGLVSDLDVENAATALGTTEASLAQYDNQIAASLNGLAVLIGEAPGTLDAELDAPVAIPPAPPQVPIGLPSSLAHRRPDIRVAEANLHRQTAEVGVATAQFYPDIKLTGLGGLLGGTPKALTEWADKFYAAQPAISVPIFEGGRLKGNLRLARANQAEAAVNYRKTVLGALQDVENALAAYRTAENSLANQHQALIQSTLALTTDVVNLYKALGGGWQSQTM